MTKIEKLIHEIAGDNDDWRDVFQIIHNIGYNSDFTYDPSVDMKRTSLYDYLTRLVEIINED
jgi:hypothetical protein